MRIPPRRFLHLAVGTALAGLSLLLSATNAQAEESQLLGTWKLKSWVREVAGTGERYNQAGEHPDGYISYSADGRMYAFIIWDNRIRPRGAVPTDEERVKLHQTMLAYAGTYTVLGDKVVHHRDASWDQTLIGTDQVRFFKLDGNMLTIRTGLDRSLVDGREGQAVLAFEKVKRQP
jgi:Lipocalin-like domain